MIVKHQHCRICNGQLKTVLDLGNMIPSSFDGPQETYPLELTQCQGCTLVQLRHTIDLDLMYRNYWYRSALNKTMVDHLLNVADSIMDRVVLRRSDVIIDIGCNDGTLLDFFPGHVIKFGYDPALNLAEAARRSCDFFINDYFYGHTGPKASVITAIAMFYDLEDPIKFLRAIKDALRHDGIFVIEMTDLLSILKQNAFDAVCHEHIEIYSVSVLEKLLDDCGLVLFDVEHNEINGGSIRAFCGHAGNWYQRTSVDEYTGLEDEYFSQNTFDGFLYRIKQQKMRTLEAIAAERLSGRQVFALGASTKGATLLQYFGIDSHMIPYALEVHRGKIGKQMIQGTQVIEEKAGLAMNPGALLVLPWHYKEFFIDKLSPYLDMGGKLIFPLPECEVVCRE